MKLNGIDSPLRALVPVLALLLTGAPQSWAQQSGDYYHHHMWGGGWYGWLFGPMAMILLVGLIVIGVVLVVRWLGGGVRDDIPGRGHEKSPVDILKERFARGEIDKEEFEERRRTLEE